MKLVLSVDSVKYPLTGIGRYTYELASRLLSRRSEIDEIQLMGTFGFLESLPIPSSTKDHKHRAKVLAQKSYVLSTAFRLASNIATAHALRGKEDFLFHGPNFSIPHFAGKKVATFHDLSPFIWAECLNPKRARYLQSVLTNTITNADALIVDSEFTRQEVAGYFNWPIENIHTVPLACGAEFHPRSVETLVEPLAVHDLVPGRYALYVGTIEPRKNVLGLIEAYSRLSFNIRSRYPLVLSGHEGWRSEAIHTRIQQAESEGWLKYLGFTASEQLPFLYAGARLFAFPSHYEGFGLPVLEAMASGIPIVCSDSSCLPELASNVALTCSADDIEALTINLERGLLDEAWRTEAISNGLSRASKLSWERCVDNTLNVYKRM